MKRARRAAAFTLVELMVVMLVVAILAAGLAIPIAAQLQLRRYDEARRQLEEAREALLGFASAHGRLPCPAVGSSRGQESFAAAGDAANGACLDFHSGFLPAAALGLSPLDDGGFARDPWGTESGRIRYAVASVTLGTVPHALTRADGLRAAGLPALGAAPHFLFVCASGEAATGAGCGPASQQLTRKAAFVLLSPGPNASLPGPAAGDEARNLDGDAVFVSREASDVPGRVFDDVLLWGSVHQLAHRLVSAGRLP
ncbi:MAG TPA: prepilin-type N-terminal cleavage/methylation domain-containing protein [Usitatibacter sp.]|nr:prepilin-type N-terminal cleavage/methylation domain-containing protein [Usitatibacter sp.]